MVVIYILVGLGLIGTYLKWSGRDQQFLLAGFSYLVKPDEPFDPDKMVTPPNYTLGSNWASLPSRNDEVDIVPIGVGRNA